MFEKQFEKELCDRLIKMFPGAFVLKLDPLYIQGIPDRLILFEDKWASLEFKRARNSSLRMNQSYYINLFNKMSYASFVNNMNEKKVIDDLQRLFNND